MASETKIFWFLFILNYETGESYFWKEYFLYFEGMRLSICYYYNFQFTFNLHRNAAMCVRASYCPASDDKSRRFSWKHEQFVQRTPLSPLPTDGRPQSEFIMHSPRTDRPQRSSLLEAIFHRSRAYMRGADAREWTRVCVINYLAGEIIMEAITNSTWKMLRRMWEAQLLHQTNVHRPQLRARAAEHTRGVIGEALKLDLLHTHALLVTSTFLTRNYSICQ